MYCRYCGSMLPEGSIFCGNCGKEQNVAYNPANMQMGATFMGQSNNGNQSIIAFMRNNHLLKKSGLGIISCIIGTLLLFIRSLIKSGLFRKSVNTGWAGIYDEPAIVSIMMLLGTALIFVGVVWFCLGIVGKGRSAIPLALCLGVSGIVMIIIKSVIHSIKYRKSVNSGWMGIYDEPASIPICNQWGWCLIAAACIFFIIGLLLKGRTSEPK